GPQNQVRDAAPSATGLSVRAQVAAKASAAAGPAVAFCRREMASRMQSSANAAANACRERMNRPRNCDSTTYPLRVWGALREAGIPLPGEHGQVNCVPIPRAFCSFLRSDNAGGMVSVSAAGGLVQRKWGDCAA